MDIQYPWLDPLLDQWRALYTENRLHHAILLVSAQGMGRRNALRILAKLQLCQSPQQGLACGECHSCQLFRADTHPDFYVLAPEAKGKQIGIDAVRKANEFAWKTSAIGTQRVIMIESAELLGEAAANALLKTLEEPPENCQFLLYSNAIDRLLPTITSRCGKWMLDKQDEVKLLTWMERELAGQGIERNALLDILRLNAGAPITALNFIKDKRTQELDALITSFSAFVRGQAFDFQALAKQCEDAFPDSLHWLSYLLLDVAKYQQGAETNFVLSQRREMVEPLAQHITSELVFEQYYKLNTLTRSLLQQSGLNRSLLISNWLLDF